MRVYTFYACTADGVPDIREVRELPYDSAAFQMAGDLLNAQPGAAYVSVWEGDRPVLSRHREGPVIRSLDRPHPQAGPGGRANP
jgi:hypothetical protein